MFMAGLIWVLAPGNTTAKDKSNIYSSENWDDLYGFDSKDPRGLHLMKELISTKIGEQHALHIVNDVDSIKLLNNNPKDVILLGVAESFSMGYRECKKLKDLVNRGATLFISSNSTNSSISTRFFEKLKYSFDYSDKVQVRTPNDTLAFYNVYQQDTIGRMWMLLDEASIADSIEILSLISNEPNFIHYSLGEGDVYLHTNPELLCNYQLITEQGFANCYYMINEVFSEKDVVFLQSGQSVIVPEEQSTTGGGNNGGNKKDNSNLRYILESQGGFMALLLSILAIILFVIFRSKRKRPIVPYIGEQKDMTLAFAETITSIYISKKNPYGILQLMRKNFFATIQKHFFIDLSRRNGNREIVALSEKSNVAIDDITELISRLEANPSVAQNDKHIHETQRAQHRFYKSAGILADKLIETVQKKQVVINRSLMISTIILLIGILLIMFGLFQLTQANGIGILFWPIGGLIALLGILRLSFPYIKIEGEQLTFYGLFGQKSKLEISEIIGIKKNSGNINISIANNRQLNINLWDLDAHDKKQLEQLISSLQAYRYE